MDEVQVRVGDAERRVTDARLQQAVGAGQLTLHEYDERAGQVWAARTRAELDAAVCDLPVAAGPSAGPAPAGTRGAARTTARTRRVLAVMSGDELTGPVAPGQALQAYAVMGGARIDLRRDDLPDHVAVSALALMGGVEVLVPRGATVHLSGLSVMGGRSARLDPPRPGGPVVDVRAYAVMGGVEVTHGDDQPVDPASRREQAVSLRKDTRARAGAAALPALPALPGLPAPPARRGRRTPVRRRIVAGVVVLAAAFGVSGVVSADDAAVFGDRTVTVHAGQSVHVAGLFGSVEVVVDDGVPVDSSGTVVFGSDDCAACSDGTPVSGPAAHVYARGAFGSVHVVHRAQRDAPDPGDGG